MSAITPTPEPLSDLLLRRYRDLKASRSDRRPVRSNTASKLAWPCPCNPITGPRYTVLRRLHWEAAPLPSPETQMIYDEGNLQEKAILRDLQDAGFELIEQQTTVEWKQFQISGHLDAKILIDGLAIPLEVKSLSPWSWDSHRVIDDFFHSKMPWMRGYPGQLLIYMLLSNAERGLLVTKNKQSGKLHAIDFDLNTYLHETEEMIQIAEQTNAHLAAGTVPAAVPFEDWVCSKCDMYSVCQPPIAGDPPTIIDDPTLLEELIEHEQVAAAHKRYEALDKGIKKRFDTYQGVHLIGDYAIDVKIAPRERKELVGTGAYFDSATIKIKRFKIADQGAATDE